MLLDHSHGRSDLIKNCAGHETKEPPQTLNSWMFSNPDTLVYSPGNVTALAAVLGVFLSSTHIFLSIFCLLVRSYKGGTVYPPPAG